MKNRRRVKYYIPLQDRLSAFIQTMRARADLVPPGPERDELLEKAHKAENAAELWDQLLGIEAAEVRRPRRRRVSLAGFFRRWPETSFSHKCWLQIGGLAQYGGF
jgi:hypothetical protein